MGFAVLLVKGEQIGCVADVEGGAVFAVHQTKVAGDFRVQFTRREQLQGEDFESCRMQEIETTAQQKLQELCDQYETGITVAQVVLQDVNPPDAVKPSWDEVNQAQQQRDRLINEARAESTKVIPRSSGEASREAAAAD